MVFDDEEMEIARWCESDPDISFARLFRLLVQNRELAGRQLSLDFIRLRHPLLESRRPNERNERYDRRQHSDQKREGLEVAHCPNPS